MDKFKTFLSSLYNGNYAMLYFYIILGVLALIFIILIIITSIKGKKEIKHGVKEESKNDIPAKEIPLNAPYKSEPINTEKEVVIDKPNTDPLTINETQINMEQEIAKPLQPETNNVFLARKDTDEVIKSESDVKVIMPEAREEIKPIFPEHTVPSVSPIFPEEGVIKDTNPIFLGEKKEEQQIELPKLDIKNEDINIAFPSSVDGKSISELMHTSEENKKLFETVHMEPINPKENLDLNATIEIPKMKPLDLEKDFTKEIKAEPIAEAKKETEVKEVHIEEAKPVILSNEELKARLAKLKQKEEPKNDNVGLDDIMKSVGLENLSMDDEEKRLLGR